MVFEIFKKRCGGHGIKEGTMRDKKKLTNLSSSSSNNNNNNQSEADVQQEVADLEAAELSEVDLHNTGNENGAATGTTTPASDFSFDLSGAAVEHVAFLRHLHNRGITERAGSESLRRYRALWMPMLANRYDFVDLRPSSGEEKRELVPPPDIAWLWHCHRLAPTAYKRFVEEEFSHHNFKGRRTPCILDLNDPVSNAYATQSNSYTASLWNSLYPDEPFFLSKSENNDAAENVGPGTIRGFDLLASAKTQAKFLWQVQSITPEEMKRAVDDYLKFLRLMRRGPLSFALVPTMAIDLIWHTHMTGSTAAAYRNDTLKICGVPFDHDVSLSDREVGSRQDVGFRKTGELFRAVYGDPTYTVSGGYRGEPPDDYFPSGTKKDTSPGWVTNPDTEDNESFFSKISKHMSKRSFLITVLGISIVVGAILLLAGFQIISGGSGYICGSKPPSSQYIQNRGVPVCLRPSVARQPLCLAAKEDPDDPPAWCSQNVENRRNFWLWWSPCNKCGTAWRLDEERDDDKSTYKLPASKPGPDDVPPSSSEWLQWTGSNWGDSPVYFDSCGSISAEIPSQCFAEKDNSIGFIFGGIAVVVVALIALKHVACPDSCNGNGNNRRTHSGYCGGCGGGGGGGCGGGCGGC